MNTMNMPGFTADISLYKTSGHYRAMGGTPNALAAAAQTLALSRNAIAYVDVGRNTAYDFAAQQRTVVPQLDAVTFFDPFGFSFSGSTPTFPSTIPISSVCRNECARVRAIWQGDCRRERRTVDRVECLQRA